MRKADMISGIIIMAFSLFIFLVSMALQGRAAGAGFFPALLSAVLFLCGLILFVVSKKSNDDSSINMVPGSTKRVFLAAVVLIVTPFLMKIAGFIMTGFLAVFSLLRLLEVKLVKSGIIALAIALMIYYIFHHGLHVFLPEGIFG